MEFRYIHVGEVIEMKPARCWCGCGTLVWVAANSEGPVLIGSHKEKKLLGEAKDELRGVDTGTTEDKGSSS
jgi:hypothetical protein